MAKSHLIFDQCKWIVECHWKTENANGQQDVGEIILEHNHLQVQIKSRRMRWAGHVARMGDEKKVYKVLVGKPEGKRPLGRPKCGLEDGIRLYLGEIGLGCVDWIRLAQDKDRCRAVVSAVMNLWVLGHEVC
jgi:hypothetical protein